MKTKLDINNVEELVDNSSYVGIVWLPSDHKSFLFEKKDDQYIGADIDTLSIKSKWWTGSKFKYCKHVIEKGNYAYVFSTPEELFAWLINKNSF